MPSSGTAYAESTVAILGHLRGFAPETVARLRGGAGRVQQVRLVGRDARRNSVNPVHLLPNPLVVGEQAVLYPDGWLVVARLAPYRIDWLSPNGQWVRGPPLPYERFRVSEAEKRAAMRRRFGERADATPTSAFKEWPPELPAFLDNALLPLHGGYLAVRRTPVVGRPGISYDVVDRRGALVAFVRLPENERIVGFGRVSTYVARVADDGGEYLERRPLVRLPNHGRDRWRQSRRSVHARIRDDVRDGWSTPVRPRPRHSTP